MSNEQVIFLLAYYDKKLGPQLLGKKFLSKPGMPSFSRNVLQNITVDSLLTRSNPLILYNTDKNNKRYIIQVMKFAENSEISSSLFSSSMAIIFFIPKSSSNTFPIPIRKEFVHRIYNECQCVDSAEYFVFNFNLGLEEYLNTVKSQS
ncbi:MAG: hypothetical protein JW776_10950 [Candidatus Lokiarchaeota archaeon]|nr:hypothetical protein [Candidatus Lokiarchaeota archaeon]